MDGEYREGAVDLLGILAYGALAAFERLAEDAGRAPTLADKVHGAEMAAEQVAHFDRVRDRLAELDVDVMAAMQPFHAAFNAYHEHTQPKDWLEGLVWTYVGNGFAADFYREVAAFVDADTRSAGAPGAGRPGPGGVRDRAGAGRDRRRPEGRAVGSPSGAAAWWARR